MAEGWKNRATIEEKITCEKSQVVPVLNANDCGKGRVLAFEGVKHGCNLEEADFPS